MNGRQLADAARRLRPGLPVLFTTGYARNAIVHGGRLDPGLHLITKPFTAAGAGGQAARGAGCRRGLPPRILLVEDEVLVRMVAVEVLREAGFEVEEVGSADEAMERSRQPAWISPPRSSISACPTGAPTSWR